MTEKYFNFSPEKSWIPLFSPPPLFSGVGVLFCWCLFLSCRLFPSPKVDDVGTFDRLQIRGAGKCCRFSGIRRPNSWKQWSALKLVRSFPL
eukprot:g18460.t1